MHTHSRRAPTRPAPSILLLIWRALAAVLVSTVLIGTGSAAYAHDTLTDSSPTEGETLTEPPTQVQLTFSAEVLELGAAAVVTDGDGGTWEAGDPSADGTEVTVPLKDGLPNGSYEVSWRVTSSDGHPISGVIPFTVDAPAAETTEPAPADSAPSTAPSTAPADSAPTTATETSEATESAEQPAPTTGEATPATDTATTESPDAAATDAGDDSGGPWVAIVIGVAVLLTALGVYAVVRRRGADQ